MKSKFVSLFFLPVLSLSLWAGPLAAGAVSNPPAATAGLYPDPATRLNNEPGGDIDAGAPAGWDGVYENTNGAQVWNGTAWVINKTWAHQYFTYVATGERVVAHAVAGSFDGSGAPGTRVVEGYAVMQAIYSYAVAAAAGGDYLYRAVEYRITQRDGKRLILRSRGCGLGTGQAYLEIYVEDPVAGEHVAAFRGDPVMYVYDGTLEQALLITDEVQGAFASMPTSAPEARARYWLDIDGGSDMGGYSYTFRTQALACQTQNLGSSFPVDFQLQYLDPSINLVQEIRFLPRLLSEEYLRRRTYLPVTRR
jgi:hypothetical protein